MRHKDNLQIFSIIQLLKSSNKIKSPFRGFFSLWQFVTDFLFWEIYIFCKVLLTFSKTSLLSKQVLINFCNGEKVRPIDWKDCHYNYILKSLKIGILFSVIFPCENIKNHYNHPHEYGNTFSFGNIFCHHSRRTCVSCYFSRTFATISSVYCWWKMGFSCVFYISRDDRDFWCF